MRRQHSKECLKEALGLGSNYLDWRKEGASFQGAEAACFKVLGHKEHGIRRDGTEPCEAGRE